MLRLHRILVFVVFMAVIGVLPLSAMAQDGGGYRFDAPKYAARGRLPVGTFDFVIGAGTERPINATVWYPALNPDGVEEVATYDVGLGEVAPILNLWQGRAIRDAAPDTSKGPYPLVIFSPGWGGSRYYGSYMSDHLASYGFVVIGVDHTGNTLAESLADPDTVNANVYQALVYRPQDVSASIDYAEGMTAEGVMLGMIDTEKVAVLGVSFGGYTAFTVGGAQFDMNHLAEWCTNHPESSDCPYILNNLDAMAGMLGLDAIPDGLWPSLGDDRVDAIIPIVPGRYANFGPDGLKNISVPVLMIHSTHDTVVSPEEQVLAYESLVAPKTVVAFQNADHFLMGGFCPDSWAQAAPIYCWDPVWDMDRVHDLIDHFITAFLLAKLTDDVVATAYLLPSMVDFAGIAYQTTDFVD